MTSLRVDRIVTEPDLMALETDWRALETTCGNTLPFRTFTWASCWWKHLREQRRAVRDSLAFMTVRQSEGRLVGVAPLLLTERPAVGPLRTRSLRFIGADPNMTEVRGVLCEPGFEAVCYAALAEAIGDPGHPFDWLEWTGVEPHHGARGALSALQLLWTPDVVCCVLDLPATWEEVRAAGGRNLKESLRKCYNSLKRDGLDFALEVVAQGAEVPSALEDFFRLHRARADSQETPPHKDVFADAACRAFLLDVCEQFAKQGALRIFRLQVGGGLVATRVGFVLGGCLYLYYSGYEPAFAKYGVMTTALAEAIKYAVEHGLRQVNLSTGRDSSKLRWRPRQVVFEEALMFSRPPFGRAKHAALEMIERAMQQRAVRRYAERFKLLRRTV